jgi:hypothetical protein
MNTPEGPGAPELTAEAAQAIAERVVHNAFIPKKIPNSEDIPAQIAAVGGALASALLIATDMPLTALQPWVGKLSEQLVALGVRQTGHIDPAVVRAPAWIVDGVRQESVSVPDPPQHTTAEPFVAGTAEAPKCPKAIGATARAVRR